MELSDLRQDRSADFSPLPAVLAGPERGGLKSALLNSMAVFPVPLPTRASRGEGENFWWLRQDAPTGRAGRVKMEGPERLTDEKSGFPTSRLPSALDVSPRKTKDSRPKIH